MAGEDLNQRAPDLDYDSMVGDLSSETRSLLKAAATNAFGQLLDIADRYVIEDSIAGDGPFRREDLIAFCRKLGILRTWDELEDIFLIDRKSKSTATPEGYVVLGRQVDDLTQLFWLVYDWYFSVLTQEDFVNLLLSGEEPGYTMDDPRIARHPGLSAFLEIWMQMLEGEEGWPWPSTEAAPVENPYVDDTGWRYQHELRAKYGYTVSKQAGLSKKDRNRILTRAIEDLGLKEIAYHIAWQIRFAKSRHDDMMADALRKWERDLDYLYRVHYQQGFPWPDTDG